MSFQHFLLPVLDPSVKHWDDKRGGTEMTTKVPLEDKRELLE